MAAPSLPTLTTTSFAILGLLHRRAMSAYELTEVMRHSAIGMFWPRARSKLYEEPKKLAAHDYVTGTQEATGRRRTIYAITEKGEAALHDWIREPPSLAVIEAEVALKVLFADAADTADMTAALKAHGEATATQALAQKPIIEDWLASGMRFPEQAHLSAAAAALVVSVRSAFAEWAVWTRALSESWDDTRGSDAKLAWATEVYRAMLPMLDQLQELSDGKRDTVDLVRLNDLPRYPVPD